MAGNLFLQQEREPFGQDDALGVIRYEYDAENRLVKKGDVVYNNDRDRNFLRR